jgi:hypothetical protein
VPPAAAAAAAWQVLEGVTPQVQFVKIVSDELVELMGSEGNKDLNPGQPQVILMAGLQVWVWVWVQPRTAGVGVGVGVGAA